MDQASIGSIVALLLLLGAVVAVIINMWRHGNIDLTGRHANMRGLYSRSLAVGIALAALTRVNVIQLLRQEVTAFGGLQLPGIVDDVVGVVVTGAVLTLAAKLWNDVTDIVFEFKRWLRGKANSTKQEESRSRNMSPRRPRTPRRREEGRRGGGDDSRRPSEGRN